MNWIFMQPFLNCSCISGQIEQLFNSHSELHCTRNSPHKVRLLSLKGNLHASSLWQIKYFPSWKQWDSLWEEVFLWAIDSRDKAHCQGIDPCGTRLPTPWPAASSIFSMQRQETPRMISQAILWDSKNSQQESINPSCLGSKAHLQPGEVQRF